MIQITVTAIIVIATMSTNFATCLGDEKPLETLDERRAKLSISYLEKLATARREYETESLALQKQQVVELKVRLETAMKELDLDKSNSLNQEIQKVEQEIATTPLRTVFIHKSAAGESRYFLRGLNGEWIERSVSRRGDVTHVYRKVVETLEYVELTHESDGTVHRLLEDRHMYKNAEKGKHDFVKMGSGQWQYADIAARAACMPEPNEFELEIDEFSLALTKVTWEGVRGGWTPHFRFAKHGQVLSVDGQAMPQRWRAVAPGHVITVNEAVIDSIRINLQAGTMESRAFSENAPLASWSTRVKPNGP